jgi:CO/xanthine dehydrogenase Mo-binding subunit
VVAEELRLPLTEVDCVYPTTLEISATQMTVGSQSIENFFLPTASAAAALRETMRARAGASAGVPVAEIESVAFGFSLPGGRMLTYL